MEAGSETSPGWRPLSLWLDPGTEEKPWFPWLTRLCLASEAQLMDAGVPQGDGRESITQPCPGRAEQRNKQKRAGIWSFGLAPPPQLPHQTCLPLPPPTGPFTQVTIRLLTPWLDLTPHSTSPPLTHSISAHLPMCNSEGLLSQGGPRNNPISDSYDICQ